MLHKTNVNAKTQEMNLQKLTKTFENILTQLMYMGRNV